MFKTIIFLFIGAVTMQAQETGLDNVKRRIEWNKNFPQEYVEVNGLTYYQDRNVFSPECFVSTSIFAENIPYRPYEKFLEIGSGVGVIAITAALNHNEVVATDINPKAVELTSLNAELNNVEIICRQGDIFSPISKEESFDTIFWNWPFVYASEDYEWESLLERSVCDPGYKQLHQFLTDARDHLNPNGRIILTFGSNGTYDLFAETVEECCYSMEQIFEGYLNNPRGGSFWLYELKTQ